MSNVRCFGVAPFRGNHLLSYAGEWNVAASIGFINISECSIETKTLFISRKPSKYDEPFKQTGPAAQCLRRQEFF